MWYKVKKMSENVVDFKKQLIQWINENIKHPDDEESKGKSLKIIEKKTWEILCKYSENNWCVLSDSLDVGISIYNKIQEIKALNGI